MKLKTSIFIFSLLFCAFSLIAQKGKYVYVDPIKELKDKPLIVILQTEDTKLIEKLSKEGNDKVKLYKDLVKAFNENLKFTFDNFWPFSEKVDYKSYAEVIEMIKAGNQKFNVAITWQIAHKGAANTDVYTPYLEWTAKNIVRGGVSKDDNEFTRKSSYINIIRPEQVTSDYIIKGTDITSANFANPFPTRGDILEGIFEIKSGLETPPDPPGTKVLTGKEYMEGLYLVSPKLKGETLLIRKSDLEDKFDKAEIKSLYPYKFEIVADTVFDRALANKEPGKAVIVLITAGQDQYEPHIMECETNKFMGRVLIRRGMDLGVSNGYINKQVINALTKSLDKPRTK